MRRLCADFVFFPVAAVLVCGYVAWRFLTCVIDSREDIRRGQVPAFLRTGWTPTMRAEHARQMAVSR